MITIVLQLVARSRQIYRGLCRITGTENAANGRMMAVARIALVVAALLGTGAIAAATQRVPAGPTEASTQAAPPLLMNSAQSDYVEHCGGCHGIQGLSLPARVPQLRNRVGYFTCIEEGRRYLLRLPNVALSATDNEQLAAIMNFVVFGLGGSSTTATTRQFTPAEVALARRGPLSNVSLIKVRAELVRRIARRCAMPKDGLKF